MIRFLSKSLLVVPLLLLTLASLQVFTDLLLKVDCDTWEASVKPLQPGEHQSTHLPDGHRLATTCLDVDFLLVIEVRLKPVPHQLRWQRVSEVHESNSTDIGGVSVFNQGIDLLLGNLEGVELVEETEARGNNSTGRHPSYTTTHTSLTSASSFSGACCPRFQMVNLVVDLIHHLVEGLYGEQFHLEVGRALDICQDQRVNVHGPFIAVKLKNALAL